MKHTNQVDAGKILEVGLCHKQADLETVIGVAYSGAAMTQIGKWCLRFRWFMLNIFTFRIMV